MPQLVFDELQARLSAAGQDHVLRFWEQLDASGREKLAGQLADVDLAELQTLIDGKDEQIDFAAMARRAELPPAVAADGSGTDWSVEQARRAGEQALREGKLAAVLVAGGQGTRLGFDQPKGMYPVGPVTGRSLFEMFADRLVAVSRRYGKQVPLFVMVSEATEAETRSYFEENNHLGLPPASVIIFRQGTMPAVTDDTGKLLLAAKDSLALSPDGHGGTLRALAKGGHLRSMLDAGIEHLFYFQVDNPLVDLCDPVLIGHHLLAKSEMTTQVIRKRYPKEKVGNVVQVDGRTQIIEYSDLPDAAAEMTGPDGGLKLWAGNIAVHLFDLSFLDRMKDSATALPFHRAHKKVAHLDDSGQLVTPTEPNATKFERFIFDLLPSADRTIVCEADPAESFAPVKNADGAATDTPALAKAAISDLHRRWLVAAGVKVADGVQVEISPIAALDETETRRKLSGLEPVETDLYVQA